MEREERKNRLVNLCGVKIRVSPSDGEAIVTLDSEGRVPYLSDNKGCVKNIDFGNLTVRVKESSFSYIPQRDIDYFMPIKDGVFYLVPAFVKQGMEQSRSDVLVIGDSSYVNGQKCALDFKSITNNRESEVLSKIRSRLSKIDASNLDSDSVEHLLKAIAIIDKKNYKNENSNK